MFEKIFQDEADPLQCVRPQFEKKKRWVYVQNLEGNANVRYVTLGDKAMKQAVQYTETTLWAICLY